MTDSGVVNVVLHDWRTHEVIEVDPRNITEVEPLDFAKVGAFTRVRLLIAGERTYVDVSESVDLLKRSLQMGFNFGALKKSGARRHP